MKKILIIEDDQIIANIYRNKLTVEGYQVETALDGKSGLAMIMSFQPDALLLDLMLPELSGVEIIKHVRADSTFAKLPIIVFSNIYMTNMIQEAWKAGATKCLSKANCSPQEILDLMRTTIGESGTIPSGSTMPKSSGNQADVEFQGELQKSFVDSLPATLNTLRAAMQSLTRADNEASRLKQIHELYRRIHALAGNAGIAGFIQITKMSGALEAFLKELYEKPKNINQSTLRTVATAIDFLGFLFQHGIAPEKQEVSGVNVLVVDDEVISRRAVTYALEKAQLHCVNVEDPNVALNMLMENPFDLVFLDVDMPGMTGYELCTKMRALPMHKKTPVIFVTSLSDFDNRASSMMSGGNDFIGKPFLFIELTVKALIHVLRGKLQPVK